MGALPGGSGVGAPKEGSALAWASVGAARARLRNSRKASMLDANKNGLGASREDHPEAGLLGRFKGSTASLLGSRSGKCRAQNDAGDVSVVGTQQVSAVLYDSPPSRRESPKRAHSREPEALAARSSPELCP